MTLLKMYVTMFPVILAGILNMLFVKTSLYLRLRRPMDGGRTLWDGRRLFGDNKTWAGFFWYDPGGSAGSDVMGTGMFGYAGYVLYLQ